MQAGGSPALHKQPPEHGRRIGMATEAKSKDSLGQEGPFREFFDYPTLDSSPFCTLSVPLLIGDN